MKIRDLGKKYQPPQIHKPKSVTYPTLTLTTEQFPPLKGKEVGDTCRLEIAAKVVGMDHHEDRYDSDGSASYTLEIRKAAPLHGKGTSAGGKAGAPKASAKDSPSPGTWDDPDRGD